MKFNYLQYIQYIYKKVFMSPHLSAQVQAPFFLSYICCPSDLPLPFAHTVLSGDRSPCSYFFDEMHGLVG